MKKLLIASLLSSILLTSESTFATDNAVYIDIGGNGGAAKQVVKRVRKILAEGLANGSVDTVTVYGPRSFDFIPPQGQLFVCAEEGYNNGQISTWNVFSKKLSSLPPREGAFVKLQFASSCAPIKPIERPACSGNVTTELPPEMFKHWRRSYQEDSDGIAIYRPPGFSFPPSRGWLSFDLLENGEYVEYSPGPTDGGEVVYGRWCLDQDNVIKITFPTPNLPLTGSRFFPQRPPQQLEVLYVDDDILKVKQ